MKTLKYAVVIHAPRVRVWDTLQDPDGFRDWTTPFCEGSFFEGAWTEGADIRFLTPTGEGMRARIARSRPHELVSIEHLAAIRDGVDDPEGSSWAHAFETYRFVDVPTGTELRVEVDAPPEHEAFMEDAWPKALARLKDRCEGRRGQAGR